MSDKNIHIIFNPASGGGRTGKTRLNIINKIENYLGKIYTLWETEKPFDAVGHTIKAIESGGKLIIAVGGDGTIHEVVNGICISKFNKNIDCTLGIISSGTGQDFVQGFGIKGSIDYQLNLIKEGNAESIDIGMVKYKDKAGNNIVKYFANELQAGIGGKVAQIVNSKTKNKSSFFSYGLTSMVYLFKYKSNVVSLKLNDEKPVTEKVIGIIAANGNFMGGGMKLTSSRNLTDHNFDLFILREQSMINKLINFTKIYFGKLKDSELITIRKVNKLLIDSREEILMEADGEVLGTLPCEIKLLPFSLKVISNFDQLFNPPSSAGLRRTRASG